MNEAAIIHSNLCIEKNCDRACYDLILKLTTHNCYSYKEIYFNNFFLEPIYVCNDWLCRFLTNDKISIPTCKIYAKNHNEFMYYLSKSIKNYVSRCYYAESKTRTKEKDSWSRKKELREHLETADRPFEDIEDLNTDSPENAHRYEKSAKLIADLVDKISNNMQLAFLNFILDNKDEPDMYLKHVTTSNRYKLVSRMKKTLFRTAFKKHAIDGKDLLSYSNSKYLSELCTKHSSYK